MHDGATKALVERNLAVCNARTRSGNACRRWGNVKNGRCHLHGGKFPKRRISSMEGAANHMTLLRPI